MARQTLTPFHSVLAPILVMLVAEKRGIGYHYAKEEREYQRFDQFCQERGHQTLTLPRTLVEQWTAKQGYETIGNQQRRVSRLRVLGQYMQRQGYPAWVYPSHTSSHPSPRYVPYIFTREELAAFFTQIDACPLDSVSPWRHQVLPVLFRVLYGSGLRIGEALALQRRDVDLTHGTLYIRHAKFDKERRIPLHPILVERVHQYLERLPQKAHPETPLFPGPQGGPYAISTVYALFRRFLWAAGISHGGRGHGPRLHDVRHSFAVHCLRQWVTEGIDLTVALPYLSAYRGHTNLKSTQDYLRLTAECYPNIVCAVEHYLGAVIPQGGPFPNETH